MNEKRSDLRLLLQVMGGTISAPDRAVLRERMTAEQSLRQQWQQLNSARSESVVDAIACENVSPDDVAAFVDGAMSFEEETAFEAKCWESPATLLELISFSEPAAVNGVDPESDLTSRLLKRGPVAATPADSLPRINVSTERSAELRSQRQNGWRVMLVGVIAVLAVIALWAAFQKTTNSQLTKDEGTVPVPREPKQEDVNESPDADPEAPGPMEVLPPATPPDLAPEDGNMVVETPGEPEKVPEPLPNRPDSPNEPTPVVASVDWDIKGVMGARADARKPWLGAKRKPHPANSNFMTLETSRAVTTSPDGIELVLGEETEITGFAWGLVPEVSLLRGQVAFRKLPKGKSVRFVFGDETWEATAVEDETALSLSLLSLDPRIIVHTGAADVGPRQLKSNRFVEFSKPRSVHTVARRDRDYFSWVETWYAANSISPSVETELLTSANLRRDVLLGRALGPRSTMMLAPVTSVYRLLNSQNEADRSAALRWLVNNPPGVDGTPGSLAWADIATQLGNQTVADYLNGWLDRVRRKQPANDLYPQMVRVLGLRPRAARHVAISCLRYFTGRNLGYDINAPKPQRDAVVKDWSALIR